MGRNDTKKFLIIFLVLAVVYLGNRFLFHGYLQNLTYGLSRGPGTFFSRQFGQVPEYIRGLFRKSEVVNENERLKEENTDLLNRLTEFDATQRENISLRNQLNVQHRAEHPLMLAKIFSVDRSDLSSTILIDKGINDGVKKSMAVVSGGNILAGVVGEVFSDYSRVILLDDSRSLVSVRIGGSGVIGDAKGTASNGKVTLNFVTNKDPVRVDDLIVTSGLDNLPESLLVGRVEKVDLKGGNLFKDVEGGLMFNLSFGSNLFVILN